MGVCSSSNASSPGAGGGNDPEVDNDVKMQGGSCNKNRAEMEDDAFEVEDPEQATGE